MLGISFFKGQPTDYIIKYVGGRVTKEGLGRAFYYLTRNTQIVVVPTSTQDANFVFNELTNNFQSVTLQGQFTYRIAAPAQAAAQLNFAYDPRRAAYAARDPESLPGRIANIIQMETRRELGAADAGRDPAPVPGDRRGDPGPHPRWGLAPDIGRRADQPVLPGCEAHARDRPRPGGAVPGDSAAAGGRGHLRPARGGGRRGAQDQGERAGDRDRPGRTAAGADRLGRGERPAGSGVPARRPPRRRWPSTRRWTRAPSSRSP